MRVKEGTLTPRQTELMEFLWEANEPMTANKMAEKLAPAGWNNVTLFKTVQALSTDGFLEVAGLEKNRKDICKKTCSYHDKSTVLCFHRLQYSRHHSGNHHPEKRSERCR